MLRVVCIMFEGVELSQLSLETGSHKLHRYKENMSNIPRVRDRRRLRVLVESPSPIRPRPVLDAAKSESRTTHPSSLLLLLLRGRDFHRSTLTRLQLVQMSDFVCLPKGHMWPTRLVAMSHI